MSGYVRLGHVTRGFSGWVSLWQVTWG